MNIIVHHPRKPEDLHLLKKHIATVHKEAVAGYINKLSCPREEKLKLIKEMQKSVKEA